MAGAPAYGPCDSPWITWDDVVGVAQVAALWAATHVYLAGDEVAPTPLNGHRYITVAGGTSGGAQPAFPLADGAMIADGTVIWTEAGSDAAVPGCCPNAPEISVPEQELICEIATEVIWGMSCRQFGLCTITARPMPCCGHRRWATEFGSLWWGGWGYSGFGYWSSPNLSGSWTPCACGRYEYVHLGREPIAEILSVQIDGVEFSSANYKVDEWNYLVRTDGQPWPMCQDLEAADGDEGTFVVEWTYGLNVPASAKRAAAMLACQYARECGDCGELPAGTTSLSRENVTIQITDPETLLRGGRTGIRFVDQWLAVVCPDGNKSGGGIVDPGNHGQEWWRSATSIVPPVLT